MNKKEMERVLEKKKFFEDNIIIFKIIHKILNNVVFEYQLKELLILTNYVIGNEGFNEFIAGALKNRLVKEVKNKGDKFDKTLYVLKDYAIKNVAQANVGIYTYSKRDALTSYFKMNYIIDFIKYKIESNNKLDIKKIGLLFSRHTTFTVDKSAYYKLYSVFNEHNLLNSVGQTRLDELEYYRNKRLIAFSKNKDHPLLQDEIYMVKLETVCNTIDSNKRYWDFNLGKASDNKGFFIFFNPANLSKTDVLRVVKCDVSDNLKSATLASFVTTTLESARMHAVKPSNNAIEYNFYFTTKERKEEVFKDSFNYITGKYGVYSNDTKFTKKVKEILRRDYNIRSFNVQDMEIDRENFSVKYKAYFASKNMDVDNYYLVTINFFNCDLYNDLYSLEDRESKEREDILKRKKAEAKKIVEDPELLSLIKEHLLSINGK